MKYRCKKCGIEYLPRNFAFHCPKCGSADAEMIYEYVDIHPVAPHQE